MSCLCVVTVGSAAEYADWTPGGPSRDASARCWKVVARLRTCAAGTPARIRTSATRCLSSGVQQVCDPSRRPRAPRGHRRCCADGPSTHRRTAIQASFGCAFNLIRACRRFRSEVSCARRSGSRDRLHRPASASRFAALTLSRPAPRALTEGHATVQTSPVTRMHGPAR